MKAFQSTSALVVFALVTGVLASPTSTTTDPTDPEPNGLTLLSSAPGPDNITTIEYWGFPVTARDPDYNPQHLGARVCGTNDVSCSSLNVAAASTCQSLIDFINDNNIRTAPDSGRIAAVCMNGNGQCCISWNVNIGPFHADILVPAAQKIVNQCVRSGSIIVVSGFAANVLLGPNCVQECVSNRPNGCGAST